MILVLVLILILIFIIIHINISKEGFNNNKKYTLSIMAIFKNEQEYMQEWLDHHISQGFEQIYLYCNDSDIHKYYYLIDDKYKNYIKLIDWTDKKNTLNDTIQRQAYYDCIIKYSNESQFIMMLDLDEFIVPLNHNTIKTYINSLKNSWNDIKAFKIQRYDFGSNGHINKPNGKVMDNFKKHENKCSSYKTIANTDFIDKNKKFYGVHDFNFINKSGKIYNDYFSYKEFNAPNKCKDDSINEIPLIINHYYTKSYDEYMERCLMWKDGGINPIGYRKNCETLFFERDNNIIEGY